MTEVLEKLLKQYMALATGSNQVMTAGVECDDEE